MRLVERFDIIEQATGKLAWTVYTQEDVTQYLKDHSDLHKWYRVEHLYTAANAPERFCRSELDEGVHLVEGGHGLHDSCVEVGEFG